MKAKLLILICLIVLTYQFWAVVDRFIDYLWYLYKFYGYGYSAAKFISVRSVFINFCITTFTLSSIGYFFDSQAPWKKKIFKILMITTGVIWLMIILMFIGL